MAKTDSGSGNVSKVPRRTGDLAFAVFLFVVSVVLLAQIGSQIRWVAKTSLMAQPGFWPGLSLGGMTFFALIHLVAGWRDPARPVREARSAGELWLWARSLEFAFWFMAYVFAAPIAGYLPATVVFCVALAYRMGYRDRRMLGSAALLGVVVVVVFKSFLQVKIPGGELYELFPHDIRNFLITYL